MIRLAYTHQLLPVFLFVKEKEKTNKKHVRSILWGKTMKSKKHWLPLQFQRLESKLEEMVQKTKLKDKRRYTKLVDQ